MIPEVRELMKRVSGSDSDGVRLSNRLPLGVNDVFLEEIPELSESFGEDGDRRGISKSWAHLINFFSIHFYSSCSRPISRYHRRSSICIIFLSSRSKRMPKDRKFPICRLGSKSSMSLSMVHMKRV